MKLNIKVTIRQKASIIAILIMVIIAAFIYCLIVYNTQAILIVIGIIIATFLTYHSLSLIHYLLHYEIEEWLEHRAWKKRNKLKLK